MKTFKRELDRDRLVNKVGRFIPSSRKGYTFLLLFYTTFIAFGFMTFYITPCVSLPVVDNALTRNYSDTGEMVLNCTPSFDDDNSSHSIVPFDESAGVIDPTKIYTSLFGFSCSYPNYIKSTSFKFTDIS